MVHFYVLLRVFLCFYAFSLVSMYFCLVFLMRFGAKGRLGYISYLEGWVWQDFTDE